MHKIFMQLMRTVFNFRNALVFDTEVVGTLGFPPAKKGVPLIGVPLSILSQDNSCCDENVLKLQMF